MTDISKAAAAMGKLGGKVTASRRTPEQRKAISRKGGLAGGGKRWAGHVKAVKVVHTPAETHALRVASARARWARRKASEARRDPGLPDPEQLAPLVV